MRIVSKWILVSAVVSLALALSMIIGLPVMQASADHVHWDIIHLNPATTPPTVTAGGVAFASARNPSSLRSEEHTSELQSLTNLVCRLLLEKKKKNTNKKKTNRTQTRNIMKVQ